MQVTLLTPPASVFSGEALGVRLHLAEGEATILPHHAPLLAQLTAGVVVINKKDTQSERFFVEEGFVQVKQGGEVCLLTPVATPIGKETQEDLSHRLDAVQEELVGEKDFSHIARLSRLKVALEEALSLS